MFSNCERRKKRTLQGLSAAVARLVRAIMIVLYTYYFFLIIFYRGGHVQRCEKSLSPAMLLWLSKCIYMMKDEERI